MQLVGLSEGLRRMFYLVTPNETSFETVEQTPNYVNEAFPYFALLLLVEYVVKQMKRSAKEKKKKENTVPIEINDGITSIAAGQYMLVMKLFVRSFDIALFSWIYQNYCIYELPWDHSLTWWFGFLAIDFGYYWVHRSGHEVNLMWAAHQTHHSSEYYNLTTALRQSSISGFFSWMFYVPAAFFVRPSVLYVHLQFNLLYQFWIHTEEIGNLGPLEWILNTPSHHRVHHGRNRYAIDKNYGGTLIIWDRLFGTFAAERDPHTEQLAYGLVHPINTFDGTEVQFIWYKYMFGDLLPRMTTLGDKLRAVFYGPGWTPEAGKRHLRVGDVNDLPDIKGPAEVYNPALSRGLAVYGVVQFVFSIVFYQILIGFSRDIVKVGYFSSSAVLLLSGALYIISTFTIVGRCMDNQEKNMKTEVKRVLFSAVFFGLLRLFLQQAGLPLLVLFAFNLASFFAALFIQNSRNNSVATRVKSD